MFDWSKQVILLTGGTGSFGQSFTEYLLKQYPPKVIRIYSRDEFKQYEMQQRFSHKSLRFFIGDVRDEERLKRAMVGVTLVIHAAAMKQIVASEYNPTEAVKTNIFGTMNVLNVGIDAGVERIFGLITDKAVSPINLYGATKLVMEKLLIQGNAYVGKKKTKISCVRYGNVAGSRGSVIPLFLEQKHGHNITVTHPDMTRFWITLEEGVQFVADAINAMKGGEVFVPKLPSFKVVDLARAIDSHARLKFIGIRPGEKIHEDLITNHEARRVREFKNFYLITPEFDFWHDRGKEMIDGKQVAEDFAYNSGTNPHQLELGQLKNIVAKLLSKSS